MRKTILVLSVVSLLGLNNGCAIAPGSQPIYHDDPGIQAVTTLSQFDEIAGNNSEKYRGREMKLAGAIASVDETEEGYLVLAKWLPYPKKQVLETGPVGTQTDESRHFLIRFRGKREKIFYMTHGNKFLVEGKVEGTKKAWVNVFGSKQSVLYVNAQCVHLWETGDEAISSSADSEYPSTRERTLCAD